MKNNLLPNRVRWAAKLMLVIVAAVCGVTFGGCSALPVNDGPEWDTTETSSQTLLQQVNHKAATNQRWFGDTPLPKALHKVLEQEPIPERVADYLALDMSFVKSPELTAYLQGIVDNLLAGWQGPAVPVTVLVETNKYKKLRVDEYNQIIISTEFVRKTKSEDHLAILLAHELGHILLKHNKSKKTYAKTIPEAFEAAGGMALLNADYKAAEEKKIDTKAANKSSKHYLVTSFIWSDLMAPIWSRSNEQDADYIALDLVRAAGYNQNKSVEVFNELNDVEASLSKRLEALKQLILDKIAQREKMQKIGLPDELQTGVVDIVDSAVGDVVAAAFDEVAKLRAEYTGVETRIDNAIAYNVKFHGNADYVSANNPSNNRLLRRLKTSAAMNTTKLAITAQDKLVENKLPAAVSISGRALSTDSNNMFSWSIRYQVRKQQDNTQKARESLEIAVKKPDAHLSMYVDLANFYIQQKKAKEAEQVLLKGQRRLGERQKLYVPLIRAAVLQNDTEKAKRYRKDCILSLKGFMGILTTRVNKQMDQSLGQSAPQTCANVMIPDGKNTQQVAAKQNKVSPEQKTPEEDNKLKKGLNSVVGSVKDLFD